MSKKKKKKKNYIIVDSDNIKKKITIKNNSNLKHAKFGMTLDQKLIEKDQNLEEFWNSHTKEMSRKLWLPTETDCVDLHSNWLKTSLKKTESNSWFSLKPISKYSCSVISLISLSFGSL